MAAFVSTLPPALSANNVFLGAGVSILGGLSRRHKLCARFTSQALHTRGKFQKQERTYPVNPSQLRPKHLPNTLTNGTTRTCQVKRTLWLVLEVVLYQIPTVVSMEGEVAPYGRQSRSVLPPLPPPLYQADRLLWDLPSVTQRTHHLTAVHKVPTSLQHRHAGAPL